MQALVKSRAGARPLARGRPVPEPGIKRPSLIPASSRPGSAGPISISTTGTPGHDRRSRCHSSSGTSSSAASSPSAATVTGAFAPGDLVSGEGHSSADAAATAVAGRRHSAPHTQGVGVNRPGVLRRYICLPMTKRLGREGHMRARRGWLFRSAWQRRAHSLELRSAGRRRPDTGAGPIGLDGHRCRTPCRRAPASSSPISIHVASTWRAAWAPPWPSIRARTPLRDVQGRLHMKEGVRRWAGDVGQRGPALHEMITNMCHGGRIALLASPKSSRRLTGT